MKARGQKEDRNAEKVAFACVGRLPTGSSGVPSSDGIAEERGAALFKNGWRDKALSCRFVDGQRMHTSVVFVDRVGRQRTYGRAGAKAGLWSGQERLRCQVMNVKGWDWREESS